MKIILPSFFLLFISSVIPSSAQCTLGLTYAEVRNNYNSKTDLEHWEDKKANDGTPYITYDDKEEPIEYCSYLENGVVTAYMLLGDAKKYANIWATYANEHFSKQEYGNWVDYSTGTQWKLIVEDNIAAFRAVKAKN